MKMRVYSVNDRMINEYGAADGMRTGRGNSGVFFVHISVHD
jgi:hypothetical protein